MKFKNKYKLSRVTVQNLATSSASQFKTYLQHLLTLKHLNKINSGVPNEL